jgi:hypothetical protein
MAERPDPSGADEPPNLPLPTDPPSPEQPPLPEDPFTKEQIEFMRSDELLAVVLRGGPVGSDSVPTSVAGGFLYRFDEVTAAIAATLKGRRLGRRGPLPVVPDAGLFALVGVQWGHSVVFHLALGGDEQTQLASSGDVSSITGEVLSMIEALVLGAAAGNETDLWDRARELGGRAGKNYESLLEVLIKQNVDSVWRFPDQDRAISLTSTRAKRAKGILEHPDLPVPYDQEIRGFLYEINSRAHEFVLDPEGDEEKKIAGTYPEHLRERLREAWDHEVVVKLRTTHHFLKRQQDPADVVYELVDLIEIIE